MQKKFFTNFILTSALIMPIQFQAFGMTWEKQAERLQNVSAAILDSAPIPRFYAPRFTLGVFSNISILPKVNTKVGTKEEKLPAPFAHAVPALELTSSQNMSKGSHLGFSLSGGFLPSILGNALGMDSKLNQFQTTSQVWYQTPIVSKIIDSQFGLGYHFTGAKLTGKISSASSNDSFSLQTHYVSFFNTYYYLPWRIWAGYQFSYKHTKSVFKISQDKTDLTLNDNLTKNSILPFTTQVWVGSRIWGNLWVQGAYLIVPSRVILPRISIGYYWQSAKKQNTQQISSEVPANPVREVIPKPAKEVVPNPANESNQDAQE
jgi:hypothetical protein